MSQKKGSRLLQRAKNSPTGWSVSELIMLYESFGFYIQAGAKHDLAKHDDLPSGIKGTITRSSKDIHPDYVRTAVELIEMVNKKKGSQYEQGIIT